MRILIAPTAYKGTLSPLQACEAIAAGIRQVLPDAVLDMCPISDGGTGWLEAWRFHLSAPDQTWLPSQHRGNLQAGGVALKRTSVRDPLGRPIEAEYLVGNGVAILESAQACGLHLLAPDERRPLDASTEGVGDLLRAVDRPEIEVIWLGLGGSATTDGGTGALRALGFRFLQADGSTIPTGGRGLTVLEHIEPPTPLPLQGKTLILCADVRNPLCGAEGAARVFAPQKGANPQQVALLDTGLYRLAGVLQRQTGIDVATMPGTGAAGGLPAGFVAFWNTPIVSGIEWLLQHIGWRERLRNADLLITGEGQVDAQTLMGKGVGELVGQAAALGKPVCILAGRLGAGWEQLEQLPGVQLLSTQKVAPNLPPAEALTITARLAVR
ncbi:Glycerate 3-kinase [bacterium HR15]|nr:Glycerate 3-kinase [bacterium HR15]